MMHACTIRHRIVDQGGLGLADDPGYFAIRPVVGQAAHDGQRMTRIADRRETNETNTLRLDFRKQLRQFDSEGWLVDGNC